MSVVSASPETGLGGGVLRAAGLGWRSAFDHSPIGAALVGNDGTIVLANDRLARLAGRTDEEILGSSLDALCAGEQSLTDTSQWRELLVGRRRAFDCERTLRGTTGGDTLVRLSLAGLPDEEGAVHGVMAQVEDITSARDAELALAAKAMNDDLTGLPNRWLTREWVDRALAEQPAAHVGLLLVNLDRTKHVNESLGHTAGDRLIAGVAERLRRNLRDDDLIGRTGGDEFLVVIEGVRDADRLVEIAEKLVRTLQEPIDLGTQRHTATVSVGAATGLPGEASDDFIMRADMALARAKRGGRACVTLYDPASDHAASIEDLALERELRASVGSGDLRAFYQPIVSLPDRELTGYEALVRWAHAERGLMVPEMFLHIAEASGLIGSLGTWMLDRACRDAAAAMPAELTVADNTSPLQLQLPGIVDHDGRTLASSGLDPARLHLEITETAVLQASSSVLDDMAALGDLGVTLALDDFGTGYSSLTLLQSLPVQVVKIDRSFVAPILEDPRSRAVVRAVVQLCNDLGLDTVAEGIEEPAQAEALAEMGCAHAQGFFFGRPEALSEPASARH
ncbi:MAG: putative bifunctional diguanylate cyclase/phosphodiesterase [Mycobacteriales bacterium]